MRANGVLIALLLVVSGYVTMMGQGLTDGQGFSDQHSRGSTAEGGKIKKSKYKNPKKSPVFLDVVENISAMEADAWLMIGVKGVVYASDTIAYELNDLGHREYILWEGKKMKLTRRNSFLFGIKESVVEQIAEHSIRSIQLGDSIYHLSSELQEHVKLTAVWWVTNNKEK